MGVADAIRTATSLATDDGQKKSLANLKDTVKATAEKALTDADAACKAKNYVPAMKTYVSLSGAFPDEPFGKTAKASLAAAENNVDASPAIPEARAQVLMDQVTTLILQCRKAGRTGDDADVVAKMPPADKGSVVGLLTQIVKNYGQTETGQRAKAMLEKAKG